VALTAGVSNFCLYFSGKTAIVKRYTEGEEFFTFICRHIFFIKYFFIFETNCSIIFKAPTLIDHLDCYLKQFCLISKLNHSNILLLYNWHKKSVTKEEIFTFF